MGGWMRKVDIMNGYRVLTITVLLMLVLPMTAAGVETTNVTIRVDECIVLNNDICIEVIEVGSDMGWYARVRFYSYQDSIGKTATLYQGDTWPACYTSGTGMTIDVILDSAFSNGASFVIESSAQLNITDRYNVTVQPPTPITTACLMHGIWTTAPLLTTG